MEWPGKQPASAAATTEILEADDVAPIEDELAVTAIRLVAIKVKG